MLCEAVTEIPADKCQEIIDWIAGANLFLAPLGEGGGLYRYHHLFRDLLRHRLNQQTSAADISELHARAGVWFAQKGLVDEALHHIELLYQIDLQKQLQAVNIPFFINVLIHWHPTNFIHSFEK